MHVTAGATGPTTTHLTQKILPESPGQSLGGRGQRGHGPSRSVCPQKAALTACWYPRKDRGQDRAQDRSGPVLLTDDRREESLQGKQT